MLPHVTIVGRPNVWKSSIFNALAGHRIAIVSDIENTTRDIIEYHIDDEENGISYVLSDSGGIVMADNETYYLLMFVIEQTMQFIMQISFFSYLNMIRLQILMSISWRSFVDPRNLSLSLPTRQIIQNEI
jgi:small GTP-binding protein